MVVKKRPPQQEPPIAVAQPPKHPLNPNANSTEDRYDGGSAVALHHPPGQQPVRGIVPEINRRLVVSYVKKSGTCFSVLGGEKLDVGSGPMKMNNVAGIDRRRFLFMFNLGAYWPRIFGRSAQRNGR